MEYKTFENILNRIVKIKQDKVILSKAIRAFEPDCGYIFFTRYETLITDILKEAIEDKDDWIGFFLYEMCCKFSKKTIVWDKDDKPIKLRNMKDLYNLICNK